MAKKSGWASFDGPRAIDADDPPPGPGRETMPDELLVGNASPDRAAARSAYDDPTCGAPQTGTLASHDLIPACTCHTTQGNMRNTHGRGGGIKQLGDHVQQSVDQERERRCF